MPELGRLPAPRGRQPTPATILLLCASTPPMQQSTPDHLLATEEQFRSFHSAGVKPLERADRPSATLLAGELVSDALTTAAVLGDTAYVVPVEAPGPPAQLGEEALRCCVGSDSPYARIASTRSARVVAKVWASATRTASTRPEEATLQQCYRGSCRASAAPALNRLGPRKDPWPIAGSVSGRQTVSWDLRDLELIPAPPAPVGSHVPLTPCLRSSVSNGRSSARARARTCRTSRRWRSQVSTTSSTRGSQRRPRSSGPAPPEP